MLHWLGEPGDVTRSVYLSQRDVRELQFAKASIATGWRILLEEAGLAAEADIQQVLLAGSFGAYLSPRQRDPDRPGPGVPVPRRVSRGQRRRRGRQDGPALGARAGRRPGAPRGGEYVELSGRADFNDLFIDQLAFR